MIVLCGGQKGGVGKSTLAVNMAVELQTRFQKQVLLVDCDTQSTTARWASDRIDAKRKPIQCVSLHGNVAIPLRDLAEHYKIIVVDVAGRDSPELRSAMIVADMLLTPSKASQADLDTFEALSGIIEQAVIINPTIKCHVVLNMAPTNPRVNEVAQARDYLAAFPEYIICNSIVKDRKAFRDSLSDGAGVIEWQDDRAASEIRSLVHEVLGVLNSEA